MALTNPRWCTNKRLQEAAANNPVLKKGSKGMAVRLLQQALIEAEYPLFESTYDYGTPNGVYNDETKYAVLALQSANGISMTGKAGKLTLGYLDKKCCVNPPALPPLPGELPNGYMNYVVPGNYWPLQQKSANACWAAALAVLETWRSGGSITVDPWNILPKEIAIDYDLNDTGLMPKTHTLIEEHFDLCGEWFECRSPYELLEMLKRYGLLWMVYGWKVAATTGAPARKGRHAIVVCGIQGDGSVNGTDVTVLDSADASTRIVTFSQFSQECQDVNNLGDMLDGQFAVNVVHGW
jgi:peptidoglycan hydrolase-like protein with peptidoglycan-binding domain